MKQDEVNLAYQCANLYHRQGLSQEEIAHKLAISRPKVSRLLALALRVGIVTITVRPPELFDQTALESRLAKEYGLKRVIIGTPEENTEHAIRLSIGVKFTEFLSELLAPHMRIGLGVGTTLYQMARALHPSFPVPDGIGIVPLAGSAGNSDPAYQVNTIIDLFAEALGVERKYLMAPSVCESASQKRSFLASPAVADIVDEWARLDAAFFGLGKAIEDSAVLNSSFPERLLIQMVKRHAVGDILVHFLDSDGGLACPEAESLLISIPFAVLEKVPERVCLAGGAAKEAGLRAALKGGLITTLITDLFTAQLLAERRS
ncbi:MAG TPA: sugar-binding domain-containing protein [Spirochaetia bacterium]